MNGTINLRIDLDQFPDGTAKHFAEIIAAQFNSGSAFADACAEAGEPCPKIRAEVVSAVLFR